MKRTSKNTKIIQANIKQVYHAFTDPKALEHWLSPDGMTGKIHSFNLEVGGGYDMSLFYDDDKAAGKTAGNEDRYAATFVELKPCEKIVQAIRFQSDKSEFTGEMIMEVFFKESGNNGTELTIVFNNIPTGIDPKDNEAGTEQSLEKLARYIKDNDDRPGLRQSEKD